MNEMPFWLASSGSYPSRSRQREDGALCARNRLQSLELAESVKNSDVALSNRPSVFTCQSGFASNPISISFGTAV
jgi:hypothetical protein